MRRLFLLAAMALSFNVVAEDAAPADREPASINGVRRSVEKNKYFGFGPALLSHSGVSGVGLYVAAAYGFKVDSTIIRIRFDIAGRGGALLADAGLGVNYFLINTDGAPFLGLDFGYGIARVKAGTDEVTSGFVLGGSVGMQFLRTADINLEIAFRIALMLESTTLGQPAMGGFRMGLYF